MPTKDLRRCFVAIPLSNAVERELQNASRELGRVAQDHGVRVTLTRRQGRHVTIAFLGDIEEVVVAEVDRTLTQALAGVKTFSLEVRGLVTLPPGNSARVVAADVAKADAGKVGVLAELCERVRMSLEPLGFARERRSFRPHITLARIRDAKGWLKLKEELYGLMDLGFGITRVDRVALFHSHLGPGGACYEAIRTYPLVET